MLQLPDNGVRSVLRGREVKDASDVRRVMQHFGSGPTTTTYLLRNRRFIASDEKMDDVLRTLLSAAT